jgi:type VI secretion system Hcp family effector
MSDANPKSVGSLVRRPLLAAALAAGAVASVPGTAAAVDIFLLLDGVAGEVTQKGHEKWIKLDSYSVGFDSGGVRRTPGGASAGKPACSVLEATKAFDSSSPLLMTAVMTGKQFQKAEIHFLRTGTDGGADVFLKYDLQDVILSSLGDSGGSDGAPTESLSLNFGKAIVTYYGQNEKGGVSVTPTSTATVSCP